MKTSPPRAASVSTWLRPLLLCLAFLLVATPLHAATLLRQNFEAANPWSGMAGYFSSAGGSGTATPTYTGAGTIDLYGTSTVSSGIQLVVNSSAATGAWKGGMESGILSLAATTTRGKEFLTLAFSLSSTSTYPIRVKIESYNAANARSGGLETLICPAAPEFYQRYTIDLDKMTPEGAGTFAPGDPKVRIYFELDSTANGTGWPAGTHTLKVDNISYATPKYYVKPASLGGSDSKSGLDEANALATLQAAANKPLTGDNIIAVMDGADYTNTSTNGSTVDLASQAGSADAWVVFKNYPGDAPVVRTIGWNAFKIGNTSGGAVPRYIEIRGFTIRGSSYVDANGDRRIAAAYEGAVGQVNGATNGNGIFVEGRNHTTKPRHFRFADNVVEFMPGGGIASADADRIAVENNIVRNNCWWMIYAGSGISFLSTTNTELGENYRMLVLGNVCHGNETMVPWKTATNPYSDGNGIIIDSYDVGYTGKTLVQNNLVYHNGGSGIHVLKSDNVDIVHNTAFWNSASSSMAYGQIFTQSFGSEPGKRVRNVRVTNNIMVAPRNPTGISSYLYNEPATAVAGFDSATIFHQRNVYVGGDIAPPMSGANLSDNTDRGRTFDPANIFISPSTDPAVADFRLRAAAANNYGATVGYRSARDLALGTRSLTEPTDTGVYQRDGALAYSPIFSPKAGNYSATQQVTLASDTSGATIIYTTNGTLPTVNASGSPTNGTLYTAAIPVSAATTLKAIAWKSGLTTSPASTAAYTFQDLTAVPVTLSVETPTGIYPGTRISQPLTRTPGALIRYTTDGNDPTATTGTPQQYRGYLVTDHATLRYQAYKSGRANSAVVSTSITVRASMGNTADGTELVTFGAGRVRFARFQATDDFSAAYIFARITGGTGTYRAALYSDANSAPAVLLAESLPVANPATGWVAFPLPVRTSVVEEGYYWLAIWSDQATTGIYATATGGTVREISSTFSSSWPNPAGQSAAVAGSAQPAIYAANSPPNLAPVVNAGPDQSIASGATATLSGAVGDDGVPLAPGTVTRVWSKVSGPGTVSFADASSAATTATFSTSGTYVLALSAQDALLSAVDETTVHVIASGSSLDPAPPAGVARAAFSDGVGTAHPQQFIGKAGDGWADVWKTSGTPTATVLETTPLRGGSGKYLSVTRTGGFGGSSQDGVSRQWSESTRPTNQFSRVTFDFRIDSGTTVFNDAADAYTITLSSVSGAAPGNSSTVYLRAFGATPPGTTLPPRVWCVFQGTPGTADSYDVTKLRSTGMVAEPGRTYAFSIDVFAASAAGATGGKTHGTYDVTITDLTDQRTVTLAGSGFRSAAYTSGGFLAFAVQQSDAADQLGFSVDSIEMTSLAPTTTTLTSSLNPANLGALVTFTATVASGTGTPGGTVQFLDGATVLGTRTLDAAGRATLSTSALAPGAHPITAVFPAGPSLLGSSSPTLVQSIRAATATTVTSSANPAVLGGAVTFTATVESDGETPTGNVTFRDNGAVIGTATLNAVGMGSVTTSALSVGFHAVTASYGGDTAGSASVSPELIQTVQRPDGTTRLVAINSAGPAIAGSGFEAEYGFANGTTTNLPGTIDLSGATDPAPAAVYQTERYGPSITYTLDGFDPAEACLVRLHFCENWWGIDGRGGLGNWSGKRLINVALNGTQRLASFDVWASAGGPRKAIVREFAVAASSLGKITIQLTSVAGGGRDENALINGLEVYTLTPTNAWRLANFSIAQYENSSISGMTADPDRDGLSNLLERALGTHPQSVSAAGFPTAGTDPATGLLTLTFFRACSDLTYTVEGTSDLATPTSWLPIPHQPGPVGAFDTAIDNVSTSPRFLRLRVTQ